MSIAKTSKFKYDAKGIAPVSLQLQYILEHLPRPLAGVENKTGMAIAKIKTWCDL